MNIKMELLRSGIADFITSNLESSEVDVNKITYTVAINMLAEIQQVIRNENHSDFDAIEKIVCIFEKYNIDFGFRHDF
ncbi:MAG: hypothetical protein IJD91_09700 [Clostridia bacterium]|nr:hypothetical protein [Clostridia bacterium]